MTRIYQKAKLRTYTVHVIKSLNFNQSLRDVNLGKFRSTFLRQLKIKPSLQFFHFVLGHDPGNPQALPRGVDQYLWPNLTEALKRAAIMMYWMTPFDHIIVKNRN